MEYVWKTIKHALSLDVHASTALFLHTFQSRKQLYIQQCPFVRSFVRQSVCQEAKPLNSLKSSSFILHHSSIIILHSSFFINPSSFFIHPSFISRLLSFSACLLSYLTCLCLVSSVGEIPHIISPHDFRNRSCSLISWWTTPRSCLFWSPFKYIVFSIFTLLLIKLIISWSLACVLISETMWLAFFNHFSNF